MRWAAASCRCNPPLLRLLEKRQLLLGCLSLCLLAVCFGLGHLGCPPLLLGGCHELLHLLLQPVTRCLQIADRSILQ